MVPDDIFAKVESNLSKIDSNFCNAEIMISTHIIANASWPNTKNFRYYLLRISQDIFKIHFLPIRKFKIQPFLRVFQSNK